MNLEAFLVLPTQVLVQQKTHSGRPAQQSSLFSLQRKGWYHNLGKPQPPLLEEEEEKEKEKRASAWNTVPGGVAVLVRDGLSSAPLLSFALLTLLCFL